jgi:FkbM family methyltransferase
MINWTRISPRSAGGRLVRLPARLLPKSTVMNIRRGPARGLKWISGSATHGCWLGTYEMSKQALVERLVRPGMTVYDIGAQAGLYTLICSRLVGHNGRVIAFEPCVSELRYLLEHVRMNALTNVQVVQAAVGAAPSLAGFTTDSGPCMNHLTGDDSALLVPVISLDTAAIAPPDLIKMDIEGGESAALSGARTVLAEHRPIVVLALHGPEHRSFCSSLLQSLGYRVFDLDERRNGGGCAFDEEIYALP